jgi:glycosyltransferase involved in cell wall biosynthesis
LKIALATDWFAPRRGGIEGQLLELAERLASRGHEVDVLTSTPGATNGAANGAAFQVRALELFTLPTIGVAVSPALFHVLRKELRRGYDVVQAHVSVVSPVGYGAAIVARTLGLPAVVTFHSVLRHKRYLLRAVDAIARLSDSAVVWSGVSQLVARQVRAALHNAEVSVLPNGIDVAFWTSARLARRRSETQATTLVSTMRLHRKKRPLQLLRAFAQAAARVSLPVRLLIVGDGPERAALDREIRDLGLTQGRARAELLGWLDRDALRTLYAEADGFALASERESFGIAALEARAMGLPVIAMRASGSNEFLTHGINALICDDDEELVQSIARFLEDAPLRARLAGGLVALERYDWNAVLLEHEATYHRATTRAAVAAGAVVGST